MRRLYGVRMPLESVRPRHVFRMAVWLGAEVIPVRLGSGTLKSARMTRCALG